ncbi:MAG: thioredoxin [Chloroflexi bacterium]|nr:thioredoxin [Chloroflexota bacterium]
MAQPFAITDTTFQEKVLKSDKPVLVDFWAPWCGPCRMIAPIVEELAQEYDGKVAFAKLNTDENADVPMQQGIMGIPTLILFKKGKEVSRIVGHRPKAALKQEIEKVLAA